MPPIVRTRLATTVSLPSGDDGEPLPAPGRRVPLSPFDKYWVALPPVCHVFLYPSPPCAPGPPFQDIVSALRSSLATTVLPAFHPLAGELVFSPDEPPHAAVSIVCGEDDDARVVFVEAQTTELELARLVVEEGLAENDVDALRQLVPDIRRDELPAPVMAVQVTEFIGGGGGGGVAVGVAVHHAAVDGRGLWRFIEMWAAAAAGRGLHQEGEGLVVVDAERPLHDRRLVHFDGDDEVSGLFLRQVAPDLPRVRYLPKIVPTQDPSTERQALLSRRTLMLPASTVHRLKQRLTTTAGVQIQTAPPSTFATIAAHAWVSLARASGFTDSGAVFAVFLADCRALISPPAPDSYAGNCLALCVASLSAAELAGEDDGGHARAFLAIKKAVDEVRRDPLAECSRWVTRFRDIPPGRAVVLAGSPRFRAYDVDFGFGRPARVEKTSLNHDGEISLVAGREPGSVQASVILSADKMPAFLDMFVIKNV